MGGRPSFEEFIFHRTGKRLRAYERDYASLRIHLLFEDGTEGMMVEGLEFDAHVEIQPVHRFCASCGGSMHASSFDWLGRCHTSVSRFWEKVRKLYWHRHTQARSTP